MAGALRRYGCLDADIPDLGPLLRVFGNPGLWAEFCEGYCLGSNLAGFVGRLPCRFPIGVSPPTDPAWAAKVCWRDLGARPR
jgi:hypothetical protein